MYCTCMHINMCVYTHVYTCSTHVYIYVHVLHVTHFTFYYRDVRCDPKTELVAKPSQPSSAANQNLN